MSRAITFLFLLGNLGIFLASASRKRADSDKVVALIRSRANHVAALEAQTTKLKSENQQLATRVEYALADNARGPWSKVQIWGWVVDSEGTHQNRIWGLTDASGYLPENLQQNDPKLQVELNGFPTFKDYEDWLVGSREPLCVSCAEKKVENHAHIDLYSPYVVVDGTYIGGYQEFATAIAENYPSQSASVVWGQAVFGPKISQMLQIRKDDEAIAENYPDTSQSTLGQEPFGTKVPQMLQIRKDDEIAVK